MKDTPGRAQIGQIGEETAAKYLKSKGFEVVERNYWKKWGEIDIVARKDGIYHFVEVKTVTRKLSDRITPGYPVADDGYLAEENVHPWKLQRLSRAIQTYCLERRLPDEQEWQIDVVAIELDFSTRRARIRMIGDIS